MKPSDVKIVLQRIRNKELWEGDGDYSARSVNVEALNEAITLTEMAEAKQPVKLNTNVDIDGNWMLKCPHCGAVLMERIVDENDEVWRRYYNRSKYCDCGQKIDWSEVEEYG